MGFFNSLFGGGAAGGRSEIVVTSSEVASHQFAETKFREGYDSEEVVALLNRAVETLHAYENGGVYDFEALTAEEVVNVRFSQTKFRTGWDQDEVDNLLDDVTVTLRAFEQQS